MSYLEHLAHEQTHLARALDLSWTRCSQGSVRRTAPDCTPRLLAPPPRPLHDGRGFRVTRALVVDDGQFPLWSIHADR